MSVSRQKSGVSVPSEKHPFSCVEDAFRHSRLGRKILFIESLDSTNNFLKELAAEDEPGGTVVLAGCQTAGRGRLGRPWISPHGSNLYMSTLIRLPENVSGSGLLTLGAAVAVAETLDGAGAAGAGIKWPNDVLLSDRKVSGILAEGCGPSVDRGIVLGIGVNLDSAIEDLPVGLRQTATSVRAETGRTTDRVAFAADLLGRLNRLIDRLVSGDRAGILLDWKRWNVTIGRDVTVREGKDRIRGRAVGIDENGALLVHTHTGRTHAFYGGRVTLR